MSENRFLSDMRYYLAPLEGVTTSVYRNAYHKYFRPMDKYFTPFLAPHTKKGFSARELKEILPERNKGMCLVPQIMSNDAGSFLQTVDKLKEFGYREVNLNLGCPSKTVVSKGRGSGFLAKPEELERFLEAVCSGTDVRISIKTRIGRDDPQEFPALMDIYNKFPLEELIIHPRVQQDFYKNVPDLDVFAEAFAAARCPVCYNGDIFTAEDFRKLCGRFPEVRNVMLGRGVVGNPGIVGEIEEGMPVDAGSLRGFHEELLAGYVADNFGDRNVLFKMKEVWCYMKALFPGEEKQLKKIKKAERLADYAAAADGLFSLLS